MTDFVKVKALRTFDAGSGLKTVDSHPFDIEKGVANELRARELVEFVSEVAPEPESVRELDPEPELRDEKPVEGKRKGRS